MNTEEQTDSRCLSPTTPGHNHGARCKLPAYAFISLLTKSTTDPQIVLALGT